MDEDNQVIYVVEYFKSSDFYFHNFWKLLFGDDNADDCDDVVLKTLNRAVMTCYCVCQ